MKWVWIICGLSLFLYSLPAQRSFVLPTKNQAIFHIAALAANSLRRRVKPSQYVKVKALLLISRPRCVTF